MKRNRNRGAFMAAWISTGDVRLLIKSDLGVGGRKVVVAAAAAAAPAAALRLKNKTLSPRTP